MESANRVPGFSTGISGLDQLLDGGLPENSIVLISGRPGTGKTTLALQILANAVKQRHRPPFPVAFLSFDEDPANAFKRFSTSYERQLPSKLYAHVEANENRRNKKRELRVCLSSEEWAKELSLEDMDETARGPSSPRSKSVSKLYNQVRDCGIWVIDGFNSLLYDVRNSQRIGGDDLRTIQANIRRTFMSESADSVPPQIVIVTAEAKADRSNLLLESYFADVVINLEDKIFIPDPKYPDVQEHLLQCKVPKGRGLHAQRRGVSYEFVPGNGIVFYPTYPAAGQVSLFRENRPQQNIVNTFIESDVPSIYPGLSVRPFGRDALYHEYAIRRRERAIPTRYDMRVSALDEYWPRSLFKLLEPIEIERLRPYEQRTDNSLVSEYWNVKKRWLEFSFRGRACTSAVPLWGNIGLFVCKSIAGPSPNTTSDNVPFWTWEDVEEYCEDAKLRGKGALGIEMKVMDSFVSFLLELCWSHLGGWHTEKEGKPGRERLRVTYAPGHSADGVIAALERFRSWVHDLEIVKPYSTLSMDHPRRNKDWAFARNWYSTLVEGLTESKLGLQRASEEPLQIRSSDLRILPIPIPRHRKGSKFHSSQFHSAWGDWSLGIWKGTENKDLAIDIINTMISSRWQINAAVTGASLPLYESFFEEFGNAKCFGTNLTFDDLRRIFYPGAFSRGYFREFRFSMQRFYAVAATLLNDRNANSGELWNAAVKRIESWSQ